MLDDLPHDDYYPEPGQQTPSFQATVEDADDEDGSNLTKESGPVRYVEPFPGPAGEASRQEKTQFEVLQLRRDTGTGDTVTIGFRLCSGTGAGL